MAVYFDGTTEALEPATPASAVWDFGTGNASFGFCIKRGRTGHAGDEGVIDKYQVIPRVPDVGWAVRTTATDDLVLRWGASSWSCAGAHRRASKSALLPTPTGIG
jgi:hypothetical protein